MNINGRNASIPTLLPQRKEKEHSGFYDYNIKLSKLKTTTENHARYPACSCVFGDHYHVDIPALTYHFQALPR